MAIQQVIFPTSIYGRIGDVYGTAVTAYANTQGFPGGAGLVLGQFGVLFDGTEVRLLNATAGIAQFNAVTYVIANSSDYQAVNTTAVNQPVVGFNDRAGSTALVANNIAWMTTRGVGTVNAAATITAPAALVSSVTAGQLGSGTVGTSIYEGFVQLLNTTTTAGSYPAKIIN